MSTVPKPRAAAAWRKPRTGPDRRPGASSWMTRMKPPAIAMATTIWGRTSGHRPPSATMSAVAMRNAQLTIRKTRSYGGGTLDPPSPIKPSMRAPSMAEGRPGSPGRRSGSARRRRSRTVGATSAPMRATLIASATMTTTRTRSAGTVFQASPGGIRTRERPFRAGPSYRYRFDATCAGAAQRCVGSTGPELVGLLHEAQVGERLGVADAPDALEALVQEPEQALVVLRHGLDEDVEPPGGHHDVVDLRHLGKGIGDLEEPAGLAADPNERLLEAQLPRIGDADDLQDPALHEAVRAGADGGLGHAERRGDLGEGPTAVRLEVLDDSLVELAELVRSTISAAPVRDRIRTSHGRDASTRTSRNQPRSRSSSTGAKASIAGRSMGSTTSWTSATPRRA